MPTVQNVNDLARVFLNDLDPAGGSVFTDTRLIPVTDAAVRAMHSRMAEAGIRSSVRLTTLTAVPANTVLIDFNTAPPAQLPSDLVIPHRLRERANGSGDNFQDMEKFNGLLPDLEAGQFFGAWDWRDQDLLLPPVNRAMDLEIEYEVEFTRLTAVGDVVPIEGSELGLAYWVASVSGRSRGARGLAADYMDGFVDETERLIGRHIRVDQQIPRRKQAYNYNFGRGGFR